MIKYRVMEDDILTEQLKTGDILLFNRNWTYMLVSRAILVRR